jgi:hypothetical protein
MGDLNDQDERFSGNVEMVSLVDTLPLHVDVAYEIEEVARILAESVARYVDGHGWRGQMHVAVRVEGTGLEVVDYMEQRAVREQMRADALAAQRADSRNEPARHPRRGRRAARRRGNSRRA